MKQNNIHIPKDELQELVLSCDRILTSLVNTNLTAQVKYKQLENIINSVMNIECLFAYLYAEVEMFGNISDVLTTKSEVYARYTLTASLVFSQPNAMFATTEKLSKVWSHVKSFIQNTIGNTTLQAISNDINSLDDAMCLIISNQLDTQGENDKRDTILKSKVRP